MIKRFYAPTLMLTVGLVLGACTPFAGYVSDRWPTWAGGMPKDVPPRPGAPGYEEFLAHQQGKDAAPVASSSANGSAETSPSAAPADKANAQTTPSANRQPLDLGAVRSGLY
jgi:hypothetical protein